MAEPDGELRETALAVVWRRQVWRCEYWKAPSAPGSLRLFREETIAMERRVRDLDEMLLVATTWKSLIEDEFSPLRHQPAPAGRSAAEPDAERRRLPPERRAVPRGGRRQSDPRG